MMCLAMGEESSIDHDSDEDMGKGGDEEEAALDSAVSRRYEQEIRGEEDNRDINLESESEDISTRTD